MPLTLNSTLDSLKPSGIRRFSAMAKATPGCISLTLGEPDGNTDEAVKSQVTADLAANLTHYPANNGQPYLREAIATHMRDVRGLAVLGYTPDEIVVTSGATEALFAALSTMLNPGDEVIIPAPAYILYESIATLSRATPVFMDTCPAGFQITRDMLTAAATERTKAVIITSPNNPTGCVLSEDSLDAVADFARERDVFVICDDVYGRLVYAEGFQSFAARHPELRDRIVVCDSFSKPYAMTGWRLGWIAADASFIAQAAKMHQYMVSSVPSFVQHAAVAALESDIEPALEVYQERRDLVLRRLNEIGLPVNRPDGAFYAFPSIERFGLTSEEFCERLIKEAGVALVPGALFGAEGYVRLSYCCSMDDIAEGLNRLEAFVRTLEH